MDQANRGAVPLPPHGVPGAVVIGQYTDAGHATFNPHLDLNQKHLDVCGCRGGDVRHLYRFVQVMARHGRQFRWSELISREYDLDSAQAVLVPRL